jgi:hypothetical protein
MAFLSLLFFSFSCLTYAQTGTNKKCTFRIQWVCNVKKVISGSGNRSNPHPDRGHLPCMAVGPLLRSATIKRGARRGTGTNVHRAHSAPTNPND